MAKKEKKSKKVSLRSLSEAELKKLHNDYKKELQEIRFSIATSSYNNVSRVKQLKRSVARILTILKENELNIEKNGGV